MIYTVTFNPSLDYVVQMQSLTAGTINRTTVEHIYPGGKGVNVSVILSNLGIKSRVLGFKAGFTGENLENMLKDYGCSTDLIKLDDGFTRINVKINAGEETEINGQGPFIGEGALGELFTKLDMLKQGDILVLAGSIPNTLPSDVYERIMERLKGRGIRFVVDATKNLLLKVLKYEPFLIKPNNHELGEMFGKELHEAGEITAHAEKLQKMGAKNVLVSMAGDGAILVTEAGEVYQARPPKGKVINSVGAGDSMVAGFLTGYMETGEYEQAFRLGIAAGSASAFCSWLASKEEIERLLESME